MQFPQLPIAINIAKKNANERKQAIAMKATNAQVRCSHSRYKTEET
jgi:hypothetical protein